MRADKEAHADPAADPAVRLAALGRVMGELVHDLSNEIMVLHGWALLARGEMEAGRPANSEVDRVLDLSSTMGRMLRDVLNSLAGETVSPEAAFDPLGAAERTLNRRVREFSGLSVRLYSTLPDGTRVSGRASFWERVLANLLSNAGRHARERVDVSLRAEAGGVLLRVEDDGAGVDPASRGELFRPLWRGEVGETGLGLSSAAWAAEQLGGEIRYRDDSALGGAAFEVWVPQGLRLGVTAPPAPTTLEGVRLMLVEDEAGVRLALSRLLERAGAEVRTLDPAGEPEEMILQALIRAMPDAVLLDLRLGDRGGLTLWRRLRDELPELAQRVCFVSGGAPGDGDWEAALETGQPLLAKPPRLEQLMEVVGRLARRE